MHSVLITIAQILRETAHELEVLGSDLCADPQIVTEHCHALQAVDVMVQRHHGLASVLEGQCEAEEIERMTLEALRDRLRLPQDFPTGHSADFGSDEGEWWSIADTPALTVTFGEPGKTPISETIAAGNQPDSDAN